MSDEKAGGVTRAGDGAEQRARELKAAFLRKLAHEMRTPLGSMLMLAELLADNVAGRLGDKEVGYARKILRAGAEIRGLLTEVLDLSRIETGAVPVDPADVDVAELLQGLAAGFPKLAGGKPLELEADLDPGLSTVRTERRQLARLVRSLLARAARVTPEGTVTLRAARAGAEAAGLEGPAISIAVGDRGPRIPEDRRATLFEPFQPGERGLGLATARALAELLGGRLVLRDEEGKGNLFVVYLPLA